ncbi:MAG: hypothetical protein BRD50_04435 [Bacteroidetes bacterium SW_11_45_7]|nr:MAG: hypothetical protein BRD50_04435 [Bacteroidetes bacterium SW_11_45_7]
MGSVILLSPSCKDKATNGWDTDVLTPLANAKLNVNDIVADSLVEYQQDSSLRLVYSNTIYEFDPTDELLQIPDTSLENKLQLDSIVPMANVDHDPYDARKKSDKVELFRKNKLLVYNFNGPELTFFRIKSGQFKILITSTLQDTLYFDFELNEARDQNGAPLTESDVLLPAPPNGSSTIERSFDLSGYEVDLRGPDQKLVNSIQPVLVGKVDSLGDLSDVTPQDSIYISYQLKDIVPQYVKGYLGNDTVEVGQGEIKLDLFKNLNAGLVDLAKVEADFSVINGLGVNGQLDIKSFEAIKGSQTISLTSPLINKPIKIDRAYDNPRITNTTDVSLSGQNSNVKELLELLPSRIFYNIEAFINPRGNFYNYQDFGYYDSQFDVNVDVELPLQARLKDLFLRDTTDFNIGLTDQEIKNIEKGELNLIAYNHFPYDVDVQLYLYDNMFNLKDSLFLENTIASGRFNDSCRVVGDQRTVLTSKVDNDRLKQLQKAEKAIVQVGFSNPEVPGFCTQRKLKLYDNYAIDLTLSARFKYLLQDAF